MKLRGAVTVLAAAVTVVLGVWGYWVAFPAEPGESNWLRALDNIYRTIRLFVMEGDPADSDASIWQLSLARLSAAVTVFGALIWATFGFFRDRIRLFRAGRWYSRHYIICGVGDRGWVLADDLLDRGEQVVLIDTNARVQHIDRLRERGAVVIHGDATDAKVLQTAGIARAAHLVTLTDDDAVNLDVLRAVLDAPHDTGLHCHIHLIRMESRALFEEGGCFSIERILERRAFVTPFNLYELAAVALFRAHTPGAHADVVGTEAEPVRFLIAGFGKLGWAVLAEAMASAHFCNGKPAEFTVLDPDAEDAEKRFHARHHQVRLHSNGSGLDLWRLRFVPAVEAIGSVGAYHHVVAAQDDAAEALASILGLHERFRMEPTSGADPRFSFHAPRGSQSPQSGIEPFGEVVGLCNSEMMINCCSERAARQMHHLYARSKLRDRGFVCPRGSSLETCLKAHDTITESPNEWLLWENLPLYKRRSNLAEKRHIPIKLLALGLTETEIASLDSVAGEPVAGLPHIGPGADDPLQGVEASAYRLTQLALSKGLSLPQVIERYHRLAESEHTRWNAFHVLDNWRYGETKEERRKTHNCLLGWTEMKARLPQYLKYDYKNVYQVVDVVRVKDVLVWSASSPRKH